MAETTLDKATLDKAIKDIMSTDAKELKEKMITVWLEKVFILGTVSGLKKGQEIFNQ